MGLYEEAALRDPEDIPTLNELALLLWDARHDANTALQVRPQLVGGVASMSAASEAYAAVGCAAGCCDGAAGV